MIYPLNHRLFLCSNCGTPLEIKLTFKEGLSWRELINESASGVWRYAPLIPLPANAEKISMCEGGTPLLKLGRLSRELGIRELYGKLEGLNPTGSFKDRGMAVCVSVARFLSVKAVIVASTGNTASSASAYSSRAGIKCYVLIPREGVAEGKVFQTVLHGATLIRFGSCFDDALNAVVRLVKLFKHLYPLNSFNPWRIEGQKTLAYELVEGLGRVPDAVVVPVGNAGNISAIWKGFKELRDAGVINDLPRMYGVQALGASPLVTTWLRGGERLHSVESPETIASAIRIGRPISWFKAVKAVRESHGSFISVSDEEILESVKRLARVEGVGVEPASASALAGARRLVEDGYLRGDECVALVLTGHALKDPGIIELIDKRVVSAHSFKDLTALVGGGSDY